MAEFLDMGGYAAYVWSAYGIAAIALVGATVWSFRTMREKERQAARTRAPAEDV